jgi:hypothetical protein
MFGERGVARVSARRTAYSSPMTRLPYLAIPLTFLCTACGSSGAGSPKVTGPPPGAGKQVTNSDWAAVVTNPDAFRGATATLVGRVISVRNSSDGRYRAIYVWANARKSRQQTTIIASGARSSAAKGRRSR